MLHRYPVTLEYIDLMYRVDIYHNTYIYHPSRKYKKCGVTGVTGVTSQ